jgi:hypothetical protein
MGTLTLSSGTPVNGLTFFSITSSKAPNFAAWYTFVDGYLVAASSQGNLVNAIQNEQTGHTLTSSSAFRAQLPADGYANFSAMLYTNLGSLGSLAQQFSKSTKQKAVTGFLANSGPALICVYGENDHITAATKGSFMGFDLGALIGLQQGKPMHSMIASIPIGAKKEILN